MFLMLISGREISSTNESFQNMDYCLSSNLCGFVLENTTNGELRCVAMGTGRRYIFYL